MTQAILSLIFAALVAGVLFFHFRRKVAWAGTVPGSFPPLSNMIQGQIAIANKLGNTAAFATTTFFTAPVAGYYAIGATLHVDVTDGSGSLALTVTIPGAPSLPGVQPNLGTPVDGHWPFEPVYLAQGANITAACTASGLGATTFDVWVFAQKLDGSNLV
jgi:hypothetical protein